MTERINRESPEPQYVAPDTGGSAVEPRARPGGLIPAVKLDLDSSSGPIAGMWSSNPRVRRSEASKVGHLEESPADNRLSRNPDLSKSTSQRIARSPIARSTAPELRPGRRSITGGPRLQRKSKYFNVDDDDIHYEPKIDDARGGMTVLKKPKKLRSAASIVGRVIQQLPAGKSVQVLDDPARANKASRHWARVKTTVHDQELTGYINTQDPTSPVNVRDTAIEGPIMDPEAGPEPEDVAQHMLGTCFLLGPLMSLARRQPDDVRYDLFATDPTKPADSYTIRFYRVKSDLFSGRFEPTGDRDTVTVRSTILTTSGKIVSSALQEIEAGSRVGAAGDWPWPAIIEKAFLAWPRRLDIDHGDGGRSGRGSMYLTGDTYVTTDTITGSDIAQGKRAERRLANKQAIVEACQRPGLVAAATLDSASDDWAAANPSDGTGGSADEPMVGGIAFGHVYEVVAAGDDTITLRNPWGRYGRVGGDVDEGAAESILTWDEFWEVSESGGVSYREPAPNEVD